MSRTSILLEAGTNELEIVEFYLDEENAKGGTYRGYFGINVAKVLEIVRMPEVTEMPETPHPAVLGAFNHRDHVIPLVDLARWLGKTPLESEDAKVVITEFNNVVNGFLVSGVTRIHRLGWDQIEPPSEHMLRLSGETITGVVKIEKRVVFILDMEKIITDLNPDLGMQVDGDEEFAPAGGRRCKVLIADDSSPIRRMVGDALKRQGFDVMRAENGQVAWDALLKLKARTEAEGVPLSELLHVVVSDIEMPVMDGHNLCKRIKEDPVLKALPVVLFSSLITDRLRHKGEAVGADHQLSKPDLQIMARTAREFAEKFLEKAGAA